MYVSLRGIFVSFLVLAALTAGSTSVQAAGMTTIQELADMIRQQQKQLQRQQQKMQALQSKLDALVRQNLRSQSAAAAMPAKEENKIVLSRDDRLQLTVKGHVNRAVMLTSDGNQTDAFHVDNDTEPTLINFTGTVAATGDLTIGAQFEAQLASNASNAVSQVTENASTGSISFAERHLEVFLTARVSANCRSVRATRRRKAPRKPIFPEPMSSYGLISAPSAAAYCSVIRPPMPSAPYP